MVRCQHWRGGLRLHCCSANSIVQDRFIALRSSFQEMKYYSRPYYIIIQWELTRRPQTWAAKGPLPRIAATPRLQTQAPRLGRRSYGPQRSFCTGISGRCAQSGSARQSGNCLSARSACTLAGSLDTRLATAPVISPFENEYPMSDKNQWNFQWGRHERVAAVAAVVTDHRTSNAAEFSTRCAFRCRKCWRYTQL